MIGMIGVVVMCVVLVGLVFVGVMLFWFGVSLVVVYFWVFVWFGLMGLVFLVLFGLLLLIWVEKFDYNVVVINFVIVLLLLLLGMFYVIDNFLLLF